jgi:hypothetical protein
MKTNCNHAVQEIQSWKAHQLRSVRQDKARSEILDALDESSVFITQDWAMKFLPQKYRESQSDWFGKRGISWHISVAVRKKQCTTEPIICAHSGEFRPRQLFSCTHHRARSTHPKGRTSRTADSISAPRQCRLLP